MPKKERLSFLLTNGKWLASKYKFETTQNSEDFFYFRFMFSEACLLLELQATQC